jgi:BON domain-containing protein
MAASNRPNRSRFDVPISAKRAPRSNRPRSFQKDTNRAFVNAGIVVAATLLTTTLLLAVSGQIYDSTNTTLVSQAPAPLVGTIGTTPATSPTVAVATPSATPATARALATPSPSPPTEAEAASDDSTIQASIDKKIESDQALSALGITATVNDGKVVLVGTAPSDELKAKVERFVRSVRGVKQVDNQIVVITS